jgi:drug/metabolite transporter (DMT)-like permease
MGQLLWAAGLLVAFVGSLSLVSRPQVGNGWKLVGMAVLAAPAWVVFAVFTDRMSPYCREDDECAMGGALVFFAASSVTIAVIVGGLLGAALLRRSRRTSAQAGDT